MISLDGLSYEDGGPEPSDFSIHAFGNYFAVQNSGKIVSPMFLSDNAALAWIGGYCTGYREGFDDS